MPTTLSRAGKKSATRCSIIITNYNGRHLLNECLPSVLEAVKLRGEMDEVILVDDCSSDDSVRFVAEHFPSVRIQANLANIGFQRASNIGAMIARFPIIVLLNNDVAVEPDSITRLCDCFERNDNLFAASAKLFGWDRSSFLAGRRVAKFEQGHFRIQDVNGDESRQRLTLFATGGAAAFDREKFLELGGFDPIYHPLYWEDIDICYRAHKRGWPVVYVPDAVMYHKHRATITKTTDQKRLRLITARNSYIFLYKNILDKKMLRQHFLWTLWFFVKDTLGGKFRFQRAFLMTIPKLLKILKKRRAECRAHLLPDRAVIASILDQPGQR